MTGCPEAIELSRFCDAATSKAETRAIDAHLERCPRCRAAVAAERRLASALATLACPDPETLARFVDETRLPAASAAGAATRPAEALERVAGHVLRCEPCRDVVAWTREAGSAVLEKGEKRTSGRRRRRAPRTAVTPWTAIAGAGVAAAAAVLLFVALSKQPPRTNELARDPTPPLEKSDRTPSPQRPPVRPDEPARPDPEPTRPDPEPARPDPEPTRPDPEPARPDPEPTRPDPEPTRPDPEPTRPDPTQTTPPAGDEGPVVAALEDGLRLRRADGTVVALQGAARLAPGTALEAGRDGAAFQIGRATCLLVGEVSASAPGPDGAPALLLASGRVFVDAPDGGLELQVGDSAVRAGPNGARFALERESDGAAVVCVVAGEARCLRKADPAVMIAVDGGARSDRGPWKPERRPEAALLRARELAGKAEAAASVDLPRGSLALRALAAAERELTSASAKERARAAQAVFALRAAEPRLSKLAARLLPAAETALETLLASDADALAQEGAATPTILAALARGRAAHPGKSTLPEAERAPISRLAEALAALPAEALDAEALLALRAAERPARFRAPRALLKKDAALEPRALAELDAALNESPWKKAVPAAELLRISRALALAGQDTPERSRRIVAHAWAGQTSEALLALLVSQESRALLGLPALDLGPSSLMVVPASGGWRVTFVHRPAKRLRSLHLVASWDGWKPEGIAMEPRPDGSFVVTQVLPPGRHEYKLIVEKDAWITDPVNPLTGPSNVNETENSILLLD